MFQRPIHRRAQIGLADRHRVVSGSPVEDIAHQFRIARLHHHRQRVGVKADHSKTQVPAHPLQDALHHLAHPRMTGLLCHPGPASGKNMLGDKSATNTSRVASASWRSLAMASSGASSFSISSVVTPQAKADRLAARSQGTARVQAGRCPVVQTPAAPPPARAAHEATRPARQAEGQKGRQSGESFVDRPTKTTVGLPFYSRISGKVRLCAKGVSAPPGFRSFSSILKDTSSSTAFSRRLAHLPASKSCKCKSSAFPERRISQSDNVSETVMLTRLAANTPFAQTCHST
jgi:hypothetical protein